MIFTMATHPEKFLMKFSPIVSQYEGYWIQSSHQQLYMKAFFMKYFVLALQTLNYLYCECSKPRHYRRNHFNRWDSQTCWLQRQSKSPRPRTTNARKQHSENFKGIWWIRTLIVPISLDLKDVLQMYWQNHSHINDINETYHDKCSCWGGNENVSSHWFIQIYMQCICRCSSPGNRFSIITAKLPWKLRLNHHRYLQRFSTRDFYTTDDWNLNNSVVPSWTILKFVVLYFAF